MSSKNKLQPKAEAKRVFAGTEVGALIGDFTSQVKLITEQYGDIKKDTTFLKQDVGTLKEDVEVIKMDTEFIKHELKNKVAREEFVALER